MAEVCEFDHAGGPKTRFPTFLPQESHANADDMITHRKNVTTHRILAIFFDHIEMLRG